MIHHRHRTHGSLRGESGQAAVEFALVLPLLVVIILALIDFGFAFNYWIDQTHLASTGARYAAVGHNPAGSGTLQDYILSQGNTAELRGETATSSLPDAPKVCISYPAGAKAGDPVTVKVQAVYHWFPGLDLTAQTISGTATMRLERNPDPAVIPNNAGDCT